MDVRCPKCGSKNIMQRPIGLMNVENFPIKDDRHTYCLDCEYVGRAYNFGFPDIKSGQFSKPFSK